MMLRRIAAAACCLGIGAGLIAAAARPLAAETKAAAAATPAPEPPPAPPEPQPPPYQAQLLRLAEVMGTLAYLRDLCGDLDGAEWRKRVAALIDAEAGTQTRKEQIAGAFNRGFRGYQLTYRRCTPAAHVVISRYLDEGGRLAHEITSRYGG
jgi:uncharacterized protein (TIGR02301 family)